MIGCLTKICQNTFSLTASLFISVLENVWRFDEISIKLPGSLSVTYFRWVSPLWTVKCFDRYLPLLSKFGPVSIYMKGQYATRIQSNGNSSKIPEIPFGIWMMFSGRESIYSIPFVSIETWKQTCLIYDHRWIVAVWHLRKYVGMTRTGRECTLFLSYWFLRDVALS